METEQSGSPKQRRIRELYAMKDRAVLDQRLFPAVMARFALPDAMDMMRSRLGPAVGPAFAEDLRTTVAWLYNALSDPDAGDLMPAHERARLRGSMCEAITHIEDWAERHGTEACGTPFEDAAARRGWPDKAGRGWTPPWDILAITRPCYWSTER